MKDELSYAIITPYTIVKSRTGGVLARLLSRVDLEFCGAQVFASSRELAESYAKAVKKRPNYTQEEKKTTKLISDYILEAFSPSEGRRHRVMMLLFRGEDACRKLRTIVGDFSSGQKSVDMLTGETIRDTYADLVVSKQNPDVVSYFEPAVLTPPNQQRAAGTMKLFADFIKNEPNIVENVTHPNPEKIERTLVIIKPDNWRFPSSKPGTIIDMFSRTGLRIISCKLVQMSIAEAMEFYKPVEKTLRQKLGPDAGNRAKEFLEDKFKFTLSKDLSETLIQSFGSEYAEEQFNRIVEFMSGYRADGNPPDDWTKPGCVKSMALVYEGESAVQKIRSVLGPTDPTQAPIGTIRKEFGHNIMVNTAHASDSPESARREMDIVKIQSNNLAQIIEDFLSVYKPYQELEAG